MGTVRKRVRLENGRRVETWIADYRDAAGVRHRPEAKSKSEAKELLRQMEQEARESGQLRPENPVLSEYAAHWLEGAATRLKAKTIRSYTQLLNLYALPELGNLKLREIERRHVNNLIAQKRTQGL